jgi:hypothetical protein
MAPVLARFVPEVEAGVGRQADGVLIVTCSDLLP